MVKDFKLSLRTRANFDVVNITSAVQDEVSQQDFSNGIAVIFTPSSTSALTTMEYEEGCVHDLQKLLDEMISPHQDYSHNLRWGDGNGFSHLRASLIGPSLSIPVVNGKLLLGTWQQIVFIEFDNRPRNREIICTLVGD